MDLSKLRAITNQYSDARLVSLKNWRHASEIDPRDQGGPYIIAQDGYDPQDHQTRFDQFLLGRSGKWISLGLFYRLPVRVRRQEFVFGTVAEVMDLLGALPSKASVLRPGESGPASEAPEEDDGLGAAFSEAQPSAAPVPPADEAPGTK